MSGQVGLTGGDQLVGVWRRRIGVVVSFVLAATLLPYVPADARPKPSPVGVVDRSVPVRAVPVRSATKSQTQTEAWAPKPVRWPAAASAVVALPVDRSSGDVKRVRAGQSPVSVGRAVVDRSAARTGGPPPVAQARVEVFDQEVTRKAGVSGLLLRVTRTDAALGGAVSVEVDYSGFATAFGGDWASRLTVVHLPGCVLATPAPDNCAFGEQVPGVSNNPSTGRIVAQVAAGPAAAATRDASTVAGQGGLFAVMAAAASPNTGTFSKTSLGASAAWQAGRQGGNFAWSYPMRMPPAPGGLEPEVELSYSSGSVDGRTNAENSQTSWLGEGFDYQPGYIERSFRPCKDDLANNPHYRNATADLCWRDQNATLVWEGKSTELIRDISGGWKLADDDGSRVELLTGGSGTGHHNNERWRLTTTDGTQYYFGLTRLPGWQAGGRETGAALGVPVFSNHQGDPCFRNTGFLTSWCFMTWRWNLDYVVDAQGDSMSYWYSKDGNKTGVNGGGPLVGYERDGRLGRIEYGTRRGQEASGSAASMQVLFGTSDRCLANCWNRTTPVKANWPDVPWDLDCPQLPCANLSPSFWTTQRLTTVTTQVRNGSGWQNVDRWTLGHQLPSTGENDALTSPALWLSTIQHAGLVAGSKAVPTVYLHGTRYANRTDHNVRAGTPMVNKYRLGKIVNETGGEIHIGYEGSDCTITAQAKPDSNPKRCFPQYYTPPDSPPGWAWWNKYRVKTVTEHDLVGGSPDVVQTYDYSTAGSSTDVLWHHNDAAWGAPLDKRSWSDFRGWSTVTVTRGAANGTQSQSSYLYFRGMHADRTDAGPATRNAVITSSDNGALHDLNAFAGFLREETHYDRPGGQALEKTLYGPWWQRSSLRIEPDTHAQPNVFEGHFVRLQHTHDYTWVAHSNSWRRTETTDAYHPAYGTLLSTTEAGDPSVNGDEACTSYQYAVNAGDPWLIDSVSEEVTTNCAANPGPGDTLAGERSYYDNSEVLGAAPSRGLETRTDVLASFTGSTPTYVTTATAGYDAHGRAVREADALGRTRKAAYTPAEGGPTTAVAVTDEGEHTTTVTLNPAWGAPTRQVDANNKTTVASYDPLGRLTQVWRPGRSTSQTPDEEYAYTDNAGVANSVRSSVLGPNGNQIVGFDIYDGLLRTRQSQQTAPDGKRVISDTRYDSRGLPVVESDLYNDASGPTGTLVTFADADVPTQQRLTYDGLERTTHDALFSRNAAKWHTRVDYGGDRVHVTPPAGGIAETVIYDALERPTRMLQHKAATPTGEADETVYEYDPLDQLTKVTDPAGNPWTYAYDLRGRLRTTTDPDTGTETFDYDDADQLTTSTDGRGTVLARVYDNLSRLKELRDNSHTGNLRASWTYDTIAKGLPTSATRHHGGQKYTSTVVGYTDDYQPTAVSTTIPPAHGKLADTYTTDFTYKEDGSPATITYPQIKAAGMAGETVTYEYTNAGDVTTVKGADTYLESIERYWHGAVKQAHLGTAGKRIRLTDTIDEATMRLDKARVQTERRNAADTWDEQLSERYGYDPAGNITAIKEVNEAADSTTITQQCFRYDDLQRLTEAWSTQADTCQDKPSQAAVGGPDAYWQSFTYDVVGNRRTDTVHTKTGDTTRDYVVPGAKTNQPHTLTRRETRGGAGPATDYTYDRAGNLKTRTTGSATETLTWDPEGHLTELTNGPKTHSYTYDAHGNRLIAKDPDATTVYLGHTEIRLTHTTDTVEATRYYPNAVRSTAGGLQWMLTDHHGTGQLAINANTLTSTRRRTTPFGEIRGTPPATWPDRKGFVGGTTDPTGFTHLGAREYDPSTGRFISVDPLVDVNDPQSLHGYAYANNSPVTDSDPDGLQRIGNDGGGGGSGGGGVGGPRISVGTGGGGARAGGGPVRGIRTHRKGTYKGPNHRAEQNEMRQIKREHRQHEVHRGRSQAKPVVRTKTGTKKSPPRVTKPKPSSKKRNTTVKIPKKTSGKKASKGGPAARKKPAAAKGKVTKDPKKNKDVYRRPSGFRKGIRDKVFDDNKNPQGKVHDPVTRKEISPHEPWDMGHKPGYEFRKHQASARERGIPRKQFLDEYNVPQHYRPELPPSNRGHRGEDLTDLYLGP